MRGWERVGRVDRVTGDCDLWCRGSFLMHKGDVLRFASSERAPFRAGSVRVAAILDSGIVTDEYVRSVVCAIADGDLIYRATALGEHAFKPSTPAASD